MSNGFYSKQSLVPGRIQTGTEERLHLHGTCNPGPSSGDKSRKVLVLNGTLKKNQKQPFPPQPTVNQSSLTMRTEQMQNFTVPGFFEMLLTDTVQIPVGKNRIFLPVLFWVLLSTSVHTSAFYSFFPCPLRAPRTKYCHSSFKPSTTTESEYYIAAAREQCKLKPPLFCQISNSLTFLNNHLIEMSGYLSALR